MAAPWLWLLVLWAGDAAAAAVPPPPDAEVTFVLPAGRRECFYQGAPANASLEAEYQVPAGRGLPWIGTGEVGACTRPVLEGLEPAPTEAGDYRLCFDNSFSTISEKLVFFELLFDSARDEEEEEEEDEEGDAWPQPQDTLDVKIEDIKESIETMRSRLERSIQLQTLLRAFEARDRKLQEHNLGRVTLWSAVNLAVLGLVALLQVHLLKSLFHDKRTGRT
ncbi:TMED1 protein, partial [Bucorvus abyssinicus]|nr:TMED1 protein [Bucorvus abyssinicus]